MENILRNLQTCCQSDKILFYSYPFSKRIYCLAKAALLESRTKFIGVYKKSVKYL